MTINPNDFKKSIRAKLSEVELIILRKLMSEEEKLFADLSDDEKKILNKLSENEQKAIEILLKDEGFLEKKKRIKKMRRSDKGKYKVIGIDKFSRENWIHGEYDSAEEALKEARKLTKDAMKDATDSSVATVYYAYDPDGNYLGGDTWYDE